jgi:hypothetical protein
MLQIFLHNKPQIERQKYQGPIQIFDLDFNLKYHNQALVLQKKRSIPIIKLRLVEDGMTTNIKTTSPKMLL